MSKQGRSLDTVLIHSVLYFPVPYSCTEVKSILGLVQYYGHFVPKRDSAAPLHEVTKKVRLLCGQQRCK
uniref:Uncharacterized protein n=1 Tax=Lepeophtheirus salmonis TaxID=72036 RepID=A0A0K2VDU7_LEPSM